MRIIKNLLFVFFLTQAGLITACGGGGSSSGGSSSNNGGSTSGNTNRAPIASAGQDLSQDFQSSEVTLDGSASEDPDGDDLNYQWTVISQPAGVSVTLTSPTIDMPSFVPPQSGEYVFRLTVSDGSGASGTDEVTITLNAPPPMKTILLDSTFTDAEFDEVNNRVIVVSETTLTIIDVEGAQTTITLPYPTEFVSVSPNGNFAVVTHAAKISYIDLKANTVVKTIDVELETTRRTLPFSDIVMGDNGYAYVFSTAQHPYTISVDLETGSIAQNFYDFVRPFYGLSPIAESSLAKLAPSGDTVYSAGLHEIERLTVSGPELLNLRYDGDQNGVNENPLLPVCPRLFWIGVSDDILSGCHQLFRISDSAKNDRDHIFQLGPDSTAIRHASASPFSRKWYVLDTDELYFRESFPVREVDVYDADTGEAFSSISLPDQASGASVDWFAKFVFASHTSDALFILAVDDPETPQTQALLVHKPDEIKDVTQNKAPVAVMQRYRSTRLDETISLTAEQSYDPEGEALSYVWTLVTKPDDSKINISGNNLDSITFSPDVAGEYEFELRVSDGVHDSGLTRSSVSVFEPSEGIIYRLEHGFTDAVFSKKLDSLVYLSDTDFELVILNLSDFSRKKIPLSQQGYRIGLSPDEDIAAVSHLGLMSLVDLTSATLVDTQITNIHEGSVVLDQNNTAHTSPTALYSENLYQANDEIYSVDFDGNTVKSGGWVAYQNSELRLHPDRSKIYGISRGISPANIYKWDTSTSPVTLDGESPYHGDFDMGWNIWLSEDGEKIMTLGSNVFEASEDPEIDMTHVAMLPEIGQIYSADHSALQGKWVATTRSGEFVNEDDDSPTVFKNYYIFDDESYELLSVTSIEGINTSTGQYEAAGKQISYSQDGSKIYMLLEGEGLVDNFAVQITEPN